MKSDIEIARSAKIKNIYDAIINASSSEKTDKIIVAVKYLLQEIQDLEDKIDKIESQ